MATRLLVAFVLVSFSSVAFGASPNPSVEERMAILETKFDALSKQIEADRQSTLRLIEVTNEATNKRIEASNEATNERIEALSKQIDALSKQVEANRQSILKLIEVTNEATNKRIETSNEATNERIEASNEATNKRIDTLNNCGIGGRGQGEFVRGFFARKLGKERGVLDVIIGMPGDGNGKDIAFADEFVQAFNLLVVERECRV